MSDAKPPPTVYDERCSARHALELIANKWTMLILPLLAERPMRNGELMRRIGGISQKMLTQTLRTLERNGLVTRCDRETVPPNVEYTLSPLGRTLNAALEPLDRWAERNFDDLDKAQDAFDAQARRSS